MAYNTNPTLAERERTGRRAYISMMAHVN